MMRTAEDTAAAGVPSMHIAAEPTAKHAEYIPDGVWAELKKFYFDIAHAS